MAPPLTILHKQPLALIPIELDACNDRLLNHYTRY